MSRDYGIDGSARLVARWPAPAKLNLMLRITGRRPDGYHALQTVFQFIDKCDYLSFSVNGERSISLSPPLPDVPQEQDLCVRAALALQKESGVCYGAEIRAEKNIPMGGGLGGGSSDAATTLLALNRLWGVNFNRQRLMEIGVKLGADVPIFIYGHSAWAEGIGEEITAIDIPECWYVVVIPACHVSTAEIFSSPKLTRNNKPVTINSFLSGWQKNDCLSVVTAAYPQVKLALEALSNLGTPRLTGTGACIFAAFDSESEAHKAKSSMEGGWNAFVSKGLNKSPALERLELV